MLTCERFLVAQNQLDEILRGEGREEIERVLLDLPRSPDASYDKALHRIGLKSEDAKKATIRILSWILLASRPLRMKELLSALSASGVRETDFDNDNNYTCQNIIEMGHGFIFYDADIDIVRFVHPSVQIQSRGYGFTIIPAIMRLLR